MDGLLVAAVDCGSVAVCLILSAIEMASHLLISWWLVMRDRRLQVFEQRIELLNCSISSGLNLKSVASIRMMFDKKEHNETGSGNGGYDAFMSAVKKILKKHHLQCPQLLDYQIRIPRGGQTDALTESIITWDMNGKRVQTVGIDPDQVMAAVNATLKMLNLHLMQLDQINDKNLVESAA